MSDVVPRVLVHALMLTSMHCVREPDNAVNGLPTCANPAMNHTLRGDWGFKVRIADGQWVKLAADRRYGRAVACGTGIYDL